VYETFSVIARAVGVGLKIPFVSVTAGHGLDPTPIIAALRGDPRVALSARCLRAVDVLKDRYGIADASPFSYLAGLSPHLNLSVEPPSFVDAREREAAEPVAFYGCLFAGQDWAAPPRQSSLHFGGSAQDLRIYVCFGTVSMAYYRSVALGVFRAVADSLGNAPGIQILISLGGASLEDRDRRELERPNLRIVEFADQWTVLGEADVFFTHHGVNSTHEAVARQVPMVSYPFLGDQPAMALTCRELGLAVPLTETVRGAVDAKDVRAAVDKLVSERDTFRTNLAKARGQERDVIAQRPLVLERLKALASSGNQR
jgi:UDP:flavonoid glycosyltransferase YjiC (YdhE family)